MKKIISLFFTLVACAAFAEGGSAGNGGDVIVCEQANGTATAEMLDLFEARFFNEYKPVRLQGGNDPLYLLSQIFDDFGDVMPIRAKRFQESADKFMERVVWVEQDLEDIPDSRHIALPTGCVLRQLAIQKITDGIPRYTIDARLWRLMNPANQAALILHEILYTDALRDNHENSLKTRDVVGFLTSDKFALAGQRGEHWKETAFLKVAKLNAFMNDFHFSGGMVVFPHPDDLERLLELRPNSGHVKIKTCGIIWPTGETINHCAARKWMTAGVSGTRVVSLEQPTENGIRQAIDGSLLGLSGPIYSYTPGRMINAAAPYIMQTKEVDFRCLPGEPIMYWDSWGSGDQINRFFKTCKLDPAYPNTVVFDGVKYSVLSFNRKDDTTFATPTSWATRFFAADGRDITFASEQMIEVFGQKLPVLSIRTGEIVLSREAEWNFATNRCKITSPITGRYFDVNLSFSSSCLLKRPEGTYSLSKGSFELQRDKFSAYMTIDKPTTLKVNGETFEIKPQDRESVEVHDGVFYTGRLSKHTRLTVWEMPLEGLKPQKVVRWLPAGLKIENKENPIQSNIRAFFAYGYPTLTTPLEMALIATVKTSTGYVFSSTTPTAKFIGQVELLSGRIVRGTLSEEAIVPIGRKVTDGYSTTWVVENQKLPAHTSIYCPDFEKGYVVVNSN